MKDYSSRLNSIHIQVKSLLNQIALLKNEKNELNSSNLALQNKIKENNKYIEELNERVQLLTLTKSITGNDEPQKQTELKRKINEYIKEIDRCIALLNE